MNNVHNNYFECSSSSSMLIVSSSIEVHTVQYLVELYKVVIVWLSYINSIYLDKIIFF